MEFKQKSPLQMVADEIEYNRLKSLISEKFKHVEEVVYERIKKEMHTKRFNDVLTQVLEKHGAKETIDILNQCIEKVASDSMLAILTKNIKSKT